MRPIPVLAVVLSVAALGATVQVLAGPPPHPALPVMALFSFAVSAFRGPLR